MVSLLVPSGSNARTFTAADGSTYTPDVNGVIDAVTTEDILSLLSQGCTFLTVSPTGKNNLSATAAPGATDDTGDNYAVGSIWIDVTNDQLYVCVDATASAAVWLQTVNVTGAQTISGLKTLTGGLTFGGTTGNNDINLTDNLASALDITEAANSYLSFTTTNSSESVNLGKNFVIAEAVNIILGTTTGTKIGTATTQKLGLYGADPVAQYSTTGTTSGFTAGSGTNANDDSTYTGGIGSTAYTQGDIVRALKLLGAIAA